nr:hypothetical protein [uncultured Halomonas sp.]
MRYRITAPHGQRSLSGADRLARGLGWLSLGLGAYKTLAPHALTRALGLEGQESWVRLSGARELLGGIMTLTDDPTPGLWTRVVGDSADLVLLGSAWSDPHNRKRDTAGKALAALAALTAVDVYCAQAVNRQHAYQAGPTPDYSLRSGFPRPVEEMRGVAGDFETPRDMRHAFPTPPKIAVRELPDRAARAI